MLSFLRALKNHLASLYSVRKFYFFGRDYYCPVCDSHLRCFLAHRNDPVMQYDSLCPVCLSKSPHRRGWVFLNSYIQTQVNNISFLHVAPETGIRRRLNRSRNVQYVSGDLRFGNVDVCFDLAEVPFKAESFDMIYCCHVLNMIPTADVKRAIAELYRVLAPDGVAIIENPLCDGITIDMSHQTPEERVNKWCDADVLRFFAKNDYDSWFENQGFKVENIQLESSKPRVTMDSMKLYESHIRVLRK